MSSDEQIEDLDTVIGRTEAESLARELYLETKKMTWKNTELKTNQLLFSHASLARSFTKRASGALAKVNFYIIGLRIEEEDNESIEAALTDFIQIFSQSSEYHS